LDLLLYGRFFGFRLRLGLDLLVRLDFIGIDLFLGDREGGHRQSGEGDESRESEFVMLHLGSPPTVGDRFERPRSVKITRKKM